MAHKGKINSFDLRPGRVLARKYEVIERLGTGWEGEVYLVRECATDIERTAKLFFPHRNPGNRALRYYAQKLHKLRHCPILIQYHTQETFIFRKQPLPFLISDYVEGELLSDFIKRQPGERLDVFQAFHLLHALASGIEIIHYMQEYHGDLHTDNIIIRRYGLGFDIKLVDMYQWVGAKQVNIQDDVCDLVRIFNDAIGGQKYYARQSSIAKSVCCGLKRTLIRKKFRTAGQLREYLETLTWN
jgi:serine/threonine protein kinase